MSEERHISNADAEAIADAVSGRSRQGRLESAREWMADWIRSDRVEKRRRTDARVLSRMNQPAPTTDGNYVCQAVGSAAGRPDSNACSGLR